MIKSVLLAGFFWASANFMPLHTAPAMIANTLPAAAVATKVPSLLMTLPAPAAKAPVMMASVAIPAAPKARVNFELPFPTPSPNALTSDEQEFIERINAERTQRGLNALILDPMLVMTARAHSREMCDKDYFDHHSPTPELKSPMDRYLKSLHDMGGRTPSYLLVGENIYYCSVFNDVYNVDYGHRALMDSPGHRANILEPRFTKIGLGVYHNAKGEYWVTEMFTKDSE